MAKKKKTFDVELHVKDPDAFQEFLPELNDVGSDLFEFGEYAVIGLEFAVVDGLPVIVSAEFR